MENLKEKKSQSKRGLWKPEEDLVSKSYVETHGEGNWATVSKRSGKLRMENLKEKKSQSKRGLMRGGKSCRLGWKNYLRPNIKRGGMSKEEEDLIIRMHKLLGNRLPGRTDNEVKNYWNGHLNKKTLLGKIRETMDSNNRHDDNIHGTKKPRQSHDSNHHQPVFNTCPRTTESFDLEGNKEANDDNGGGVRDGAGAWMAHFDYDNEMVHLNDSNLVFDDEEPFTSYLDPLVLFEAFGGIQPFLH
ncbi:hypothetical protein V6N11_056674 [Hibiscus sabdariffa]|uniref:Uncharacterized protein n=1 Tax=Hibiscus sabdariffa TaxID=183260 RepID=A0ABR2T513_9ROSI